MNRPSTQIMNVPFSKWTFVQTLEHLSDMLEHASHRPHPYHLITANPEIVMKYQTDSELRTIMDEADLITPDGSGIVLASRWQGDPIAERVTGCDLLIGLLEQGNRQGWSFYFLGADEHTSQLAVDKITAQYSRVRIAGRHHGFFQAGEEDTIIADIAAAQPDVLVVALGAPAAEKWIYRHRAQLNAKMAFGVGGSLDIIAGKVKRAPLLWQRLHLEWLHRLLLQPSRWRRQLILPVFAMKTLITGRRVRS
ncbi:N-acetylglucosaminyldiphosphoundecaprenol N-acetyl-beta-D-mannosaminyltransferase [Paenibacillus solanacearum]|uniref:N-acetylglucosaminyldiphosphoundecaprenol N-acetyl-beta-D-mannosaminyltransferase n=1 Tax=Paenibacillus solanacearum TaxID=2048548 RepID=A0A916K2X1_9BACL|nr:WecB/TagA/CpsF family glycosyltransferase [Paenibacillus solanacearum]CAG7635365.1 N-acetylglucosaminyldiphosphoundecaprenol N-acetyl-beta-D-mannosaminyltransferase [Paenibacillus solanacearum]